jgi:membrane fusion protein (multidrug efflux system)
MTDVQTVAKKKPHRLRAWLIALAASVLLIGGLGYTKYLQVMAAIAFGQSFPEPAEAVIVATAESVNRAPVTSAIGELKAVDRVDLRIERAGVITNLNFKSGDTVKRGQMLLVVDASEERGDLAAADIDAKRLRTNANRQNALLAKGMVSKAGAEQSEALAAAAEARAAALRTAIGRKTIRAPFAGKVGITDLKPGQYVAEGSLVATIVGTQSGIYVDFTLPQAVVAKLDREKPVRVTLGTAQLTARIVASESSVNEASRSLGYRALIKDYDGVLPAGSMVTVEVDTGADGTVVAIPRTAVMRSPYGSTVYRLEEKAGVTRAKALLVVLGDTLGSDKVIVTSGLAAGTIIAADGVFKLRDGSLVRPVRQGGAGTASTPPQAGK